MNKVDFSVGKKLYDIWHDKDDREKKLFTLFFSLIAETLQELIDFSISQLTSNVNCLKAYMKLQMSSKK